MDETDGADRDSEWKWTGNGQLFGNWSLDKLAGHRYTELLHFFMISDVKALHEKSKNDIMHLVILYNFFYREA